MRRHAVCLGWPFGGCAPSLSPVRRYPWTMPLAMITIMKWMHGLCRYGPLYGGPLGCYSSAKNSLWKFPLDLLKGNVSPHLHQSSLHSVVHKATLLHSSQSLKSTSGFCNIKCFRGKGYWPFAQPQTGGSGAAVGLTFHLEPAWQGWTNQGLQSQPILLSGSLRLANVPTTVWCST